VGESERWIDVLFRRATIVPCLRWEIWSIYIATRSCSRKGLVLAPDPQLWAACRPTPRTWRPLPFVGRGQSLSCQTVSQGQQVSLCCLHHKQRPICLRTVVTDSTSVTIPHKTELLVSEVSTLMLLHGYPLGPAVLRQFLG